MLRFQFLYEII